MKHASTNESPELDDNHLRTSKKATKLSKGWGPLQANSLVNQHSATSRRSSILADRTLIACITGYPVVY
jgi:hypothetical protein